SFAAGIAHSQSSDGPPQRVIVKWRSGTAVSMQASVRQALSEAEARLGVATNTLRTIATGAQVVRLERRGTNAELQDFIAMLAQNPNVEYVEEDRLLKRQLTPNDARYGEQWHYFESTAGLNLPAAWDLTTGSGVTVAVLDTGYRPHADLAANIVGGYD